MTTDILNMSYLTYIASDHSLPVISNPHDRLVSVNEAIVLGKTNIPEVLLAPDFDRDKPGVLLVSDREVRFDLDAGKIIDGALDDDFALLSAESCDSVYTEKMHSVYLEWAYYTEGRANRIIEYIKENLRYTDEVEIWRIWMGEHEKPLIRTRTIPVSQLTPQDIQSIDSRQLLDESEKLHGLPVQYRLVITAE